jgi:hypothetical protein
LLCLPFKNPQRRRHAVRFYDVLHFPAEEEFNRDEGDEGDGKKKQRKKQRK